MGRRMSKQRKAEHLAGSPLFHVALRLLAVMFLVGSLAIAGFTIPKTLREIRGADHWPTTTGRITKSSTGRYVDSDSLNDVWLVQYVYAVEGQRYTHDRYSGPLNTPDDPLDTYPRGEDVEVRYDPDHPQRAFIGPGPTWVNVLVWAWVVVAGPAVGVFCWKLSRDIAKAHAGGT
ncbi:MAG: DUF3592 domain-containing protein [Planctomycetota bacterium]